MFSIIEKKKIKSDDYEKEKGLTFDETFIYIDSGWECNN